MELTNQNGQIVRFFVSIVRVTYLPYIVDT